MGKKIVLLQYQIYLYQILFSGLIGLSFPVTLVLKIRKISGLRWRSPKYPEFGHFMLFFLQRIDSYEIYKDL